MKNERENQAWIALELAKSQKELQNAAGEAGEYSEAFAAIAEILKQMMDAGAGDDALTVLSRKRNTERKNNDENKEEDKSA